ncbi:OmpA family protein [Lentimicrobium sp. L6]|uniref:OmpA family protein n=1 Tax=Lentimicrobium sp. L6 TaxID=2735916 RepID=UPI00155643F2|nr:OmpA family protein [Lentimicrobium sp. L6]NPD86817.1 OmpA family protein [Lentimicrobium sp. L6]
MVRRIYLSIAFLGIVLVSIAQDTDHIKLKKANDYFDNFSFNKAIEKYKESGDRSLNTLRNLAISYSKIEDYQKAEELFSEIVTIDSSKAEDLFLYASLLEINQKYDEAKNWMELFSLQSPNDKRVISFLENDDYSSFLEDKGQFIIEHLPFNTEHQEFGAVYFQESILFASTRKKMQSIQREWNWNELPYLSLYEVAKEEGGEQWTSVSNFSRKLDKKYHDGPVAFNSNQTKMYLTRNNYGEKSVDGAVKLKLFSSDIDEDGNWSDLEAFPYNSPEYSMGHASITENGEWMYFASDMPGGFGGVDIYKVKINTDGSYGEPINLGEQVNTEANEMFPFIHRSGILFFASDGLSGLGGLDLFYGHIGNNGFQCGIKNLGFPINTNKDDFAIVLDSLGTSGYFSSNRDGGDGDDDIYAFELLYPLHCQKILKGTTLTQTGDTIPNALVSLFSEEGELKESAQSDSIGGYLFIVEADKNYSLRGQKPTYFDGQNTADTYTEEDAIIVDLILRKDIVVLAEIVQINPIYFDFDKFNIRPDAAIELDKIVEVMNKYDSLVVELGSHTDCRGSKSYNEWLSDNRAKASAQYTKERITNPERIYGKGYGEYKLLNDCECEGNVKVNCSEEAHQLNRRTEFRVIKTGTDEVKVESNSSDSFEPLEEEK